MHFFLQQWGSGLMKLPNTGKIWMAFVPQSKWWYLRQGGQSQVWHTQGWGGRGGVLKSHPKYMHMVFWHPFSTQTHSFSLKDTLGYLTIWVSVLHSVMRQLLTVVNPACYVSQSQSLSRGLSWERSSSPPFLWTSLFPTLGAGSASHLNTTWS